MISRALTAFVVASVATPSANLHAEDPLPHYERIASARGTIRICGDTQGGLLDLLESAFIKLNPNIGFSNIQAPSELAVPGMILRIADLGIAGAPAETSQLYLLNKVGPRRPTEISIAGGSFDIAGRSAVLAIFVNRGNPIAKLTIGQLEGIFGDTRNGGWKDFLWDSAQARGPEGNLRTWGQLGLTGEWADREIHTYGLAWGGPTKFMTRLLTGDSGKWNPNYRTYNVKGYARGKALISQMIADMSADPASIGWMDMPHAAENPGLKPMPLAWKDQGPYLLPSKESLASRTYPLNRDIYIYGCIPLDYAEAEFVRFVLSAEGQRIVAEHGIYNPLTPEAAREQLAKLQ